MTDKPQELRKLDSVRAINKLMIDAEIKVGHREQHIDYIVQEILDWHNKQVEAVLDRLEGRARGAFDYEADIEEYTEDVLTSIEAERNKLKEAEL